ncbi:unnamed protein product [Leptosia nina]|uniref:Queuosine 5'-phosphate N-glycosylase/hydrolase n=1 Tax=Leptosia nina TaxID=320188 RepID=A0AAV1J8S3_9NEOP
MLRDSVLPPAESATFISEHAKQVEIHYKGINKLCEQMISSISGKKLIIPEIEASSTQPLLGHTQAVDWIFVTDTLNFCFWSLGEDKKWTVDGHTGYCALEAALHKAVKNGYNITSPKYYSQMPRDKIIEVFKGDTEEQIPLIEERISVLHEVGTILVDKFQGTFETCVKEANKSAINLLKIVIENFPCFRDEAVYKGENVSFYKRAQILVADLWNLFQGKGWGEFYDIDKITMFADYRVPQVLVYFGVLNYSDNLMKKLKNNVLIENGTEEEIEIRGCSIHSVELLKIKLQDKIKEEQIDVDVINSALIDYYLWCYRRKHAHEIAKLPFHKTLCIYY